MITCNHLSGEEPFVMEILILNRYYKSTLFQSQLNARYTRPLRKTVICIPCSRLGEAKTITC